MTFCFSNLPLREITNDQEIIYPTDDNEIWWYVSILDAILATLRMRSTVSSSASPFELYPRCDLCTLRRALPSLLILLNH